MGLDMYLSKKTYVKNWNFTKDEKKHKITVKLGGKVRKDIKVDRISYVVEEVAYWRKANHIHNWFVENVQGGNDDCQEAYLEIEQLKELRDVCKAVVEKRDDEYSEEHLPTSSGFFFGGTEYDEYYYEDCKETAEMIDNLVKEEEDKPDGCWGADYYYRASW